MNELAVDKDVLDKFELGMLKEMPPIEVKIVHRFAEGIYVREMWAKKGSWITSKIHNTSHPFTISKGAIKVSADTVEWFEIEAPFTGVTQKGTRRVGYVLEDMVWSTYHSLPFITGHENEWSESEINELVDRIEGLIIEPHENILLNNGTRLITH